jgi:hypothetical protein
MARVRHALPSPRRNTSSLKSPSFPGQNGQSDLTSGMGSPDFAGFLKSFGRFARSLEIMTQSRITKL